MEISVVQQPDSAIARILLNNNEEITTRAGAMISMSNNIEVGATHRKGRATKGVESPLRMIGGQSLFLHSFKAKTNHCEVILSPSFPGDLHVYALSTYKLILQTSAFLACTSEVDLFLGFRGIKATDAQEPLFWLSLAGKGQVILGSFGAIYEILVDGEYIVTPSHVVAFENSLDYTEIKLSRGWLGKFSGEDGIVWFFKGQGIIYCQSHYPDRFGRLLSTQWG